MKNTLGLSISIKLYFCVPILCFSATVIILVPFNLCICFKRSCVAGTCNLAVIISKAAVSIAIGSVYANIPISYILGTG